MSSRPSLFVFAIASTAAMFQLACPIVIASQGSNLADGQFSTQSDAARYRVIAEARGTPYRDFEVEYPPVAVGLFHALGSATFDGFREQLFALQVACQALIVLLLFRIWNRRTAWSYIILSAPMLFVVYNGFDLMVVALAVSAAALIRRHHPEAGAVAFVIGAFTEVWPVVLLPTLLVRRNARAFAVGAATGLAGLVAWSAWGGTGAIGQVVTYGGARGWEYESIPGSLLRLLTRDALRFENGSWRLGAPPWLFSSLLSLVAIGAVAGIWWLAMRRPQLPDGLPEAAAITALLVFGTLLSPQFLIWPLPFVAIAASAGAKRIEGWAGAAVALTLLDWISFDPYHPALLRSEIVILGRNVALVGLFVVAILEMRNRASSRLEAVAA